MRIVGLSPGAQVHLVGIGGAGLSAIARVLMGAGYRVSGSDRQASALTEALQAEGATVYIGHRADQVRGADLVIVSSAVPPDNPEVVAAREAGIPVVKRDRVLGAMMADRVGLAVAGTHGKTTTTAMIATVLLAAGLDPTFIVGGVLVGPETNARYGGGPHFVIEADEYDHTFLGLRPQVSVVTNVEHDHPDCYPSYEEMVDAFTAFVRLLPPEGRLVLCADDPGAMGLAAAWEGEVITYGLGEGAPTGPRRGPHWQATDLKRNERGGFDFTVRVDGEPLGRMSLLVPGRHNVQNSLAALAVTTGQGVPFDQAARVLADYRGTRRRFEIKGVVRGVTVVDDYAHHPTEVRATLAAARARYGRRTPIWAVFQPHTYSRTRALLDDFPAALVEATHVLVLPIYAAREPEDPTVRVEEIVAGMPYHDARVVADFEEAVEQLLAGVSPGDVVITLGAGDGYRVGEMLLERLRDRDSVFRGSGSTGEGGG